MGSVLVQTSTPGSPIATSQANAGASITSMVFTAVQSIPGAVMTAGLSSSTTVWGPSNAGPAQGPSNEVIGTSMVLPPIASSLQNAFVSSDTPMISASIPWISSAPVLPSLMPTLSLPLVSVIGLPSSLPNLLHPSLSADISMSFAVSAGLSAAPQPSSAMWHLGSSAISGLPSLPTLIPSISPINPSQMIPGYSSSSWMPVSWPQSGSMSAWPSAVSSPWPAISTPSQISQPHMSSTATAVSSSSWHVVSSMAPALSSQGISSVAPQPSGIIYSAGDFSFIGCYNETMQTGQPYTFNGVRYSNSTTMTSMTVAMCASLCAEYTYFGVEYGVECYCANQITPGAGPVSNSDCNMPCPGAHATICGSSWRLVAYSKAQQAVSSILALPSIVSAMSSMIPGAMTTPSSNIATSMPMSSASIWSTMASSMVGVSSPSTVLSMQASSVRQLTETICCTSH